MIAIELTNPREDNCENAHDRKSLKYADLMADCKDKGWSVWLFPVEVGWRGFPAQSVWNFEADHTRAVRKNTQDNNEKTAGYGTAETICAGRCDPTSSKLATTADPSTGRCRGLGSKIRWRLETIWRRSEPTDEHPGAKIHVHVTRVT